MKKLFAHDFWLHFIKAFALNLCIALFYIISGKLGLAFASVNPSATAIWAPTGIAFASLLLFGYRVTPAIFFGAFFVNFTTAGGIETSLGIALGNTLEGVVGVYLVKRLANGVHVFESVLDIFKFVLLAAVFSTMVSASIGVTTLILGGLATLNNFWSIWITWWLGDMGGNLIIAPLFLAWRTIPRINFTFRNVLNFLASFGGLFFVAWVVFSGTTPYAYLCIPVAIWIAFWYGQKGATATTIITAVIATLYTLSGHGPFAVESTINLSLIFLQAFLGIISLTSLTFATTILVIRKSEGKLAEHEKRFETLIEKSSDAIVLIDATSKILYASASTKRILGYTPEELVGTTGFDLVAPVDKKKTISILAQLAIKPGGVMTVEYRTVRKDKKIIWVEATGTNLLLEPDINAVVINFHDITEKKILDETLLEEKMEDEAMLGSIGDGVIATDSAGRITIINQTACDLLGWKQKDLMGKFITKAIPMEDESGKIIPASMRPIKQILSSGKETEKPKTTYYVRKDGTKFPIHFTLTPIILEEKIVGTIEVFQDITKEKEVDRAKSEFVSIASHQLRTPLATINWYLEELMKNGHNLGEKQEGYLKQVYFASQRMIDLINALLNASRLELGTFVVDPKKIDIPKLAEQVVQDLHPQIMEKNLHLDKHFQKDMPLLLADPNLLTIIIQNLLSNAVKYNKTDGKIELTIESNEKDFLITVADNGYGVPKTQQSKIFSRMFRADNARSVEPEGTGLGLYIIKAIVDTVGGKIWFESEENKKTVFYVSLPTSGMQPKDGQKLHLR